MLPDIYKLTSPPSDAHIRILTKPDESFYNTGVTTLPGDQLIPVDELEARTLEMIQVVALSGQHLYYRPTFRNPRGSIIGSQVLWCDVDLKDTPNAADVINSFTPKPTAVYHSGGGYHVVWVLKEFTKDKKALQRKLYGICHALKGDFSAALLENGLRVPGSPNWKYAQPGKPLADILVKPMVWNPVCHDLNSFPDGRKPAKKSTEATGPSSYKELFQEFFGPDQVKDPDATQWLVKCPFHEDDTPSLSINIEDGVYNCKASCCGVKGTAIDFYRRMKGITWNAAATFLNKLRNRSSLIKLFTQHLQSACLPLFRDGGEIVLAMRKADGNLGRFLSFHCGSINSIRTVLSILFDGSPVQQIQDAIGDDLGAAQIRTLLEEAALELGANLPHKDDIKLLGQGVHIEGDRILKVDGAYLYRWAKGTWKKVKEPIYRGRYVVYSQDDNPKPWYPDAPLAKVPEPTVVFSALQSLLNAWYFQDPLDSVWLTAYTLYLPIWQLFGSTPIHLQISGETQSGKSSLSEGWFSGCLPESVQMTPGTSYHTNVTAAGIYQTYDRHKLAMVFDEILDHDDPKARSLIEFVRHMEGGGSPIRRGSADGKRRPIVECVFPTIWSSIKIPDLMQDVNRRLHIMLPRIGDPNNPNNPPPPNPWQVIRERISTTGLKKLARAGLETIITHIDRLMEIYHRLVELSKNLKGGGYRMVVRVLPLIAIAELCGLDAAHLMSALIARVSHLEEQTLEASPAEILRQAILYRPIRQPGFEGETTLAHEIARGAGRDFKAPNEGIFFWRNERAVGISTARFAMSRGNETRITPQNVARQLANMPGYSGTTVRRIDGVTLRLHIFQATALLDGGHENGVVH